MVNEVTFSLDPNVSYYLIGRFIIEMRRHELWKCHHPQEIESVTGKSYHELYLMTRRRDLNTLYLEVLPKSSL